MATILILIFVKNKEMKTFFLYEKFTIFVVLKL